MKGKDNLLFTNFTRKRPVNLNGLKINTILFQKRLDEILTKTHPCHPYYREHRSKKRGTKENLFSKKIIFD